MFALILKEIRHRKLAALISILTITVALTSIILAMETMRTFDTTTEKQLLSLDHKTLETTNKLNDQIRRTMKGLGFNVSIYPAQQDLAEVYANGYASNTMPESYAKKLADSAIVTVNHLLPQLSQRTLWREQNAQIMLIGVDGQVPIAHRNPNKPIMLPVAPGSAIIGSVLAKKLELSLNQSITLNGEILTVKKIHAPRGSIDDITVWIPLRSAQKILNLPNRINAILALGCNCASIDRLATIRKELNAILPDTQIIEVESKALARAEARAEVRKQSNVTRQNIIENRALSRSERSNFLSILSPLILLGSLTGLFTLCLFNVRERRSEIGTLLSIGVPSLKILNLFLGRAFLIGIAGSAVTVVALLTLKCPLDLYWHIALLAPALTIISAWIPTLLAARQDPVTILKNN